jgi:hypothetical protein
MRTLQAATGAGAVALGLAVLTASPAAAVCEPYSGQCPAVLPTSQDTAPAQGGGDTGVLSGRAVAPGTGVGAGTAGVGTTSATPSTLPFTGGEVALLSVVAAAAVGSGVVLVVAGRRRPRTA